MEQTKRNIAIKVLSTVFAIAMIFAMVFAILPATAFTANAATDVAYVRKADGSIKEYNSFAAAWNAAVAENDATVGLYESYPNHQGENSYVLPENKTVTVELNGHALMRNITKSRDDGSVFEVKKNAKLIVYGGNKEDRTYGATVGHNQPVYVANADRYGYTRRSVKLYGGLITGGNCNEGAGGIMMREGANVYLYNVTVAGNYADNSGASYGDGGGIYMDGNLGHLYMEDSRICYNYAHDDGGGVMIHNDFCTVEMIRSHIDHNIADDNGGGIFIEGERFRLYGDAEQFTEPESVISANGIKDWTGPYDYFLPDELGSSVSYNCVCDAEDGGGGIYIDKELVLIEGVNIVGNIATNDNDKGNGGGVYMDEENNAALRRCNILRNKADKLGGGVYVRGDDLITDVDDNVIENCTICMNLAWDTGGAGGGIYVYRYCDLGISGKIIVRGNVSNGLANDNLYLSSDGAAVHAYIKPSLSAGSDVHVRLSTAGAGHNNRVSRDGGSYDIQHFSYDNDNNHYIGWNRDWDDRHLRVVTGTKPAKTETVTFTPDDGKRTQAIVGGYNGYDLIKGIVSYPSFPDEDADIENVFYYSDGFFDCDTNTYNPQLATLSMCLAGAAGYSNEYGKNEADGSYIDKSQNFRQFVSDIGCLDADIFVNDFNTQKPGADTIGVGIASKTIFGNKTLVIIGVRGMGYEAEWVSNMTLGSSGEAAGWSSAATQVMTELKGYLERKGINGTSANTLFWISGYSRAGATANLTAKRIVDTYDNNGTRTFAYPIEAPMGGVKSEIVAGNNYNCIHNIINQNDIVPWVGTTEMGFIRYGVDHYVPGDPTLKTTPSDGSDNNKVPEDNTAWDVEGSHYKTQLQKMLAQLAAINPDIFFDDYYHQATVKYMEHSFWETQDMIEEDSDYEDQIGTTEHFIEFFFEKLQEYAFKYKINGELVDESYRNNPRKYFSEYKIYGGRTFEQAAAFTASLIFGKSAEEREGLLNCFAGLLDRMGKVDMLHLYWNIDEDDIDDLEGEIENIWSYLGYVNAEDKAKGYHSIREYLTDDEYNELSACFKSLLFPLLCFAGEDYDAWWQDILGSLAYNIPRIIANHYPEVTHAWLRSYDFLYENDTAPVKMSLSVKTGPSIAAVQITHADETVQKVTPTGEAIAVRLDDVVRLIPDSAADVDTGESIYYQFTSPSETPSVSGYHAYSEPFVLKSMYYDYATDGEFTLWVIASHNGVKLDETKITLSLGESSAFISVPNGDTEDNEYLYNDTLLHIGESISLNAYPPASTGSYVFSCWKVYYYDHSGGNITTEIRPDKYLEYFGAGFNPSSANTIAYNIMGHDARFVPVYDKYINDLNISFIGIGLPLLVNWNEQNYMIYWSRDAENDRYVGDFTLTLPEHIKLAENAVVTFGSLDDYYISSPVIKSRIVSGQNVIFSVEFTPTDSTEAQNKYDSIPYAFEARDLNLGGEEAVKEYRFFYPEDEINAPAFEDMEFVKWENDSTSPVITRSELDTMIDNYTVVVYYRPVVNTVNVTLDSAVTVGEALPALTSVRVTITNEWQVDNAVLTYDPSGATVKPETVYVARITVNKGSLMGTNLSVPDSESVPLAGAFAFAENVNVIVKDANGNDIAITNYVFFEDDDNIILDLVFTKTGKLTIVRFADVSVTVPHSGTQEDILQALPSEVFAYLADGRMVLVPVVWNNVDDLDPETLEVQNVTAHGNYAGEDYVLADGVSLTADATVLAVERTVSPAALPGNGEYTGVQRIYLEAEDGATIYYALTEPNAKGENPDSATLDYSEYTAPVILSECEKTILLYAYAKKDGLRDSTVTIYRYEFKHDLIMHEAKNATCTEAGNIEYWQCAICGKCYSDANGTNEISLEDTIIPALSHNYEFVEFVWTEYTAQAKYVCSHDENHIALYDATVTNEVTKAATCTETGVRTYTATYDGHSSTKTETLALIAHDFGDWITTKEPTCTEKGSKHKVCTVCNEELEKADIDALGHDIVHHDAQAVACTEIGWNAYDTCTRCDYTTYEEIPATGHTPSDWITTKEPTCIEKGSKHKVCTVCNEELEKADIDALGHDYQAFVTAPTCTEQGYTTHICSRCDDSYVDTYVDALGHDWSEWTMTKEAQIGVKGEETRTCSVCGETETREIPALPYEYEVVDGVRVYKFEFVQSQVQDLSGLFAEAKAGNGKVALFADTLSLTFDVNAVNVLGGETVLFTASVSTEDLTIDGAKLVVDVTLTGTSANFGNGKVTISVQFATAVPDGKVAKVYYVNGNEKTDMNAVFEDGKVTFETPHFSTFAVVFEDEQTAPVDPTPSDPEVDPTPEKKGLSGGAIAGIVIGSVFGALLIACVVLFLLNKKGIIKLGKKD